MNHNPQSAEINYLAESIFDEEIIYQICSARRMIHFIIIQYSGLMTIKNSAD